MIVTYRICPSVLLRLLNPACSSVSLLSMAYFNLLYIIDQFPRWDVKVFPLQFPSSLILLTINPYFQLVDFQIYLLQLSLSCNYRYLVSLGCCILLSSFHCCLLSQLLLPACLPILIFVLSDILLDISLYFVSHFNSNYFGSTDFAQLLCTLVDPCFVSLLLFSLILTMHFL